MEKVIVCGGSALSPVRFWAWGVCTKDELPALLEKGWIVSTNRTYLSREQLNYLDE